MDNGRDSWSALHPDSAVGASTFSPAPHPSEGEAPFEVSQQQVGWVASAAPFEAPFEAPLAVAPLQPVETSFQAPQTQWAAPASWAEAPADVSAPQYEAAQYAPAQYQAEPVYSEQPQFVNESHYMSEPEVDSVQYFEPVHSDFEQAQPSLHPHPQSFAPVASFEPQTATDSFAPQAFAPAHETGSVEFSEPDYSGVQGFTAFESAQGTPVQPAYGGVISAPTTSFPSFSVAEDRADAKAALDRFSQSLAGAPIVVAGGNDEFGGKSSKEEKVAAKAAAKAAKAEEKAAAKAAKASAKGDAKAAKVVDPLAGDPDETGEKSAKAKRKIGLPRVGKKSANVGEFAAALSDDAEKKKRPKALFAAAAAAVVAVCGGGAYLFTGGGSAAPAAAPVVATTLAPGGAVSQPTDLALADPLGDQLGLASSTTIAPTGGASTGESTVPAPAGGDDELAIEPPVEALEFDAPVAALPLDGTDPAAAPGPAPASDPTVPASAADAAAPANGAVAAESTVPSAAPAPAPTQAALPPVPVGTLVEGACVQVKGEVNDRTHRVANASVIGVDCVNSHNAEIAYVGSDVCEAKVVSYVGLDLSGSQSVAGSGTNYALVQDINNKAVYCVAIFNGMVEYTGQLRGALVR